MLASMLALMALVGCTKFDPWEDTGRGSHYSGGNNGGNGGNGGNNGGGTTPSGTVTLTERSDWKVVYKGRGIYTADGSNDTVENFNFTYTGTNYFIVRWTAREEEPSDLKTFFKEQVDALTDHFYEDTGNVFDKSQSVAFDLMIHGDYTMYMIEVTKARKLTGNYAGARITIVEDDASQAYLDWIGNYRFSDGEIGYDIEIGHAENNLLYYVWGWESGRAAMNQDMGEDWLFARYDPVRKVPVFYVQTIGEDNEADGSRFDKVFVGTWAESDGEKVDDKEGAALSYLEDDGADGWHLHPESVKFDNGALLTYKTMRFSSWSYKDNLWYHYNASVPWLYDYDTHNQMVFPLKVTPVTKVAGSFHGTPTLSGRRAQPRVHGTAKRRPVKED